MFYTLSRGYTFFEWGAQGRPKPRFSTSHYHEDIPSWRGPNQDSPHPIITRIYLLGVAQTKILHIPLSRGYTFLEWPKPRFPHPIITRIYLLGVAQTKILHTPLSQGYTFLEWPKPRFSTPHYHEDIPSWSGPNQDYPHPIITKIYLLGEAQTKILHIPLTNHILYQSLHTRM